MPRRDEHPVLLPHVVADPDHVDAHLGEPLRRGKMVAEGDLEDRVGKVGIAHEVGQQPLIPAQRPRALKDRSDRDADNPILVLQRPDDPLGLHVELGPVWVGCAVLRERALVRQRMAGQLGVLPHPVRASRRGHCESQCPTRPHSRARRRSTSSPTPPTSGACPRQAPFRARTCCRPPCGLCAAAGRPAPSL